MAKGATARTLIEMMARQFDKAVTPKLRQQYHGARPDAAPGRDAGLDRRARGGDPGRAAVIASVYLNRLKRDMPLQADPTIQFAVASANLAEALGFGYWKRDLTRDDLNWPRRTTPTSSTACRPARSVAPGWPRWRRSPIPPNTEYLYFVAKGDGSHVFAKTDTEHAANVERYRR